MTAFTADVSLDVAALAEHLRERTSFTSNTAHANFVGRLAMLLDRQYRGAFVLACQPGWTVGTNKANVWERVARKVTVRDAEQVTR